MKVDKLIRRLSEKATEQLQAPRVEPKHEPPSKVGRERDPAYKDDPEFVTAKREGGAG